MDDIKCTCNNKGCSTKIRINFTGASFIDLQIEHEDEEGKGNYETIALDPNAIVELIKKLKNALIEIA